MTPTQGQEEKEHWIADAIADYFLFQRGFKWFYPNSYGRKVILDYDDALQIENILLKNMTPHPSTPEKFCECVEAEHCDKCYPKYHENHPEYSQADCMVDHGGRHCTCPGFNGNPPTPEKKERCTIPPAGWYCTRPKGHEGPCAAAQKEVIEELHRDLDQIAVKEEWSTPTQGSWQDTFDRNFGQVINGFGEPVADEIKSFITQVDREAEEKMKTELHQTLGKAMRRENGKWIVEISDDLAEIFKNSLTPKPE